MPLAIHFLNVGHGDCTVIKFNSGRLAIVDINNSKVLPDEDRKALAESLGYSESDFLVAKYKGIILSKLDRYEKLLVDPVDFLKANYPGSSIFRFILTHPDMDHLSGIYRLARQERIPIENFWDTNHEKEISEADCKDSAYEYLDWLQYKILRLGGDKENQVTVLKLRRGAKNQYYSEDGIKILAPTYELEKQAKDEDNYNISSYVLLIEYGACKIILGGDAEEPVWKDIYHKFPDEFLKVNLLKASHHGRKSGYYQPAVKAMSPQYTVISVGKKTETDASDLYGQYSKVFSTRYHGTITAKCWLDGDIWLYDHTDIRIDKS